METNQRRVSFFRDEETKKLLNWASELAEIIFMGYELPEDEVTALKKAVRSMNREKCFHFERFVKNHYLWGNLVGRQSGEDVGATIYSLLFGKQGRQINSLIIVAEFLDFPRRELSWSKDLWAHLLGRAEPLLCEERLRAVSFETLAERAEVFAHLNGVGAAVSYLKSALKEPPGRPRPKGEPRNTKEKPRIEEKTPPPKKAEFEEVSEAPAETAIPGLEDFYVHAGPGGPDCQPHITVPLEESENELLRRAVVDDNELAMKIMERVGEGDPWVRSILVSLEEGVPWAGGLIGKIFRDGSDETELKETLSRAVSGDREARESLTRLHNDSVTATASEVA